jgi:hypothetical protein
MFPDLLEGLTRLHGCDPALCSPIDATRLVWQLKTPSGVRLLSLETDDLGDPRACVLRSALVGYWWARGVTLRIELPPATRDDDPSLVTVTALHEAFEVRASHVDETMALLEVTLEILEERGS